MAFCILLAFIWANCLQFLHLNCLGILKGDSLSFRQRFGRHENFPKFIVIQLYYPRCHLLNHCWLNPFGQSALFIPQIFEVTRSTLQKGQVSPSQKIQVSLVAGFNPSEKYESNWKSFPNFRGDNKKYLSCHHLVS